MTPTRHLRTSALVENTGLQVKTGDVRPTRWMQKSTPLAGMKLAARVRTGCSNCKLSRKFASHRISVGGAPVVWQAQCAASPDMSETANHPDCKQIWSHALSNGEQSPSELRNPKCSRHRPESQWKRNPQVQSDTMKANFAPTSELTHERVLTGETCD